MKRKRPRFGYGDIRTGELEHVEKVVETGHRSSGSPKGWGFSMRRLAKKKKKGKKRKKKKKKRRRRGRYFPSIPYVVRIGKSVAITQREL